MKGKALGRGLSALIPGAEDKDSEDRLLELELSQIRKNPYQPREKMDPDSLRELADSIVENGIIQPLAVCERNGGYQLISGARRLKAAQLAGLRRVPVMLIEIESDEQLLELAIVENLQREDLNPIELAQGYKRLMDECGLTQDEIAKKVGKGRPTVANSLRLLKLPADIQEAVKKGDLTMGHARALVSIEDRDEARSLARRVIREGMNVRTLEKLISRKAKRPAGEVKEKVKSLYLADIENRLRSLYATKVSLSQRQKGGVIEFSYFSEDELERLLELLESVREL